MNQQTLLSVLLLTVLSCIQCSKGVNVNHANQLISLFEKEGTVIGVIDIQEDLDFSTVGLKYPLGVHLNGNNSFCSSFSGTLNGHGHSIKGLVMKNDENEMYQDSGLFCHLEGATIEQLVIDSSCHFEGKIAGGVCVSASAGGIFRNVTNKARVIGTEYSGGFVGVDNGKQGHTFLMNDCVNQGTIGKHDEFGDSLASGGFFGAMIDGSPSLKVSGSKNYGRIVGSNAGGFIGMMARCEKPGMIGFESTNYGPIETTENCAGGFIGLVEYNQQMLIILGGCTNEQIVSGLGSVGGFLGTVSGNIFTLVQMEEITNNGEVKCISDKSSQAGGLIGGFTNNSNVGLSIKNCFNTNRVYGEESRLGNASTTTTVYYYGGLIGYVSINSGKVVVLNSGNNGYVGRNDGYSYEGNSVACGLLCVNNKKISGTEEYEVVNSFNNGTVESPYSYGISTELTRAHNVVNIGLLETNSLIPICHPLWHTVSHASNVFVLKQTNSCKGGYDSSHDNGVVVWKSKSGFFWKYEEDGWSVDYYLNQDILKQQAYNKMWTGSLRFTDPLKVYIGPPFRKTFITYYGSSLDEVLDVAKVSTSEYNVGHRINDTYVYVPPKFVRVKEDMDIRLSHTVLTIGELFLNIEVEHGKSLREVPEIAPYLSDLYMAYDMTYPDKNYTLNDVVEDDLIIVIIANCASRDRDSCNGTCKWIAGKCTHSLAVGVAAIVLGVLFAIIVTVGITITIYCIAKKQNKSKNLKQYHSVESVLLVEQPKPETTEGPQEDQNKQ